MNILTSIIWFLKPVNGLHIAVYAILISLFFFDKFTLPPSKTVDDYKRIEGTLVRLYKGGRGGEIDTGQESLKLYYLSKDGPIPRSLLDKKVVAYYWPKHILTTDNVMVFITLPSEEEANLKGFISNGGFDRPSINRANMTLSALLILVVLFPGLMKLQYKHKKKI